MSGHTALPWRNIRGHIISDVLPRAGSHTVCLMTVTNNDVARAEANAAFIITACNSHAELVKALEEMLRLVDGLPGGPDEEPEEPCTALCGNSWCNECGCVNQKVKDARAALATLTARKA